MQTLHSMSKLEVIKLEIRFNMLMLAFVIGIVAPSNSFVSL